MQSIARGLPCASKARFCAKRRTWRALPCGLTPFPGPPECHGKPGEVRSRRSCIFKSYRNLQDFALSLCATGLHPVAVPVRPFPLPMLPCKTCPFCPLAGPFPKKRGTTECCPVVPLCTLCALCRVWCSVRMSRCQLALFSLPSPCSSTSKLSPGRTTPPLRMRQNTPFLGMMQVPTRFLISHP